MIACSTRGVSTVMDNSPLAAIGIPRARGHRFPRARPLEFPMGGQFGFPGLGQGHHPVSVEGVGQAVAFAFGDDEVGVVWLLWWCVVLRLRGWLVLLVMFTLVVILWKGC